MKRILLSIVATVVGLVALLSFKTSGHVSVAGGSGLPSAGLPSSPSSPSSSDPGSVSSAAGTSSASGAPPDPASSSPSATGASSAGAERTVTGSAVDTRYGVVQVKVTVRGSKIVDVAFVQLTGRDGRSNQINSDAAPILLNETLSAQSAHIDTVSGATYTSEGYVQSLQSALDQVGLR